MTGQRILVTGGAGFIGSHVAAELLQRGYKVVVLDDLSGGFRENVPAGAELIAGSILDRTLIEQIFRAHRFAYVFHSDRTYFLMMRVDPGPMAPAWTRMCSTPTSPASRLRWRSPRWRPLGNPNS